MDTEQYEDAVRDYEKVYQTEKTKGKRVCVLCMFPLSKADGLLLNMVLILRSSLK